MSSGLRRRARGADSKAILAAPTSNPPLVDHSDSDNDDNDNNNIDNESAHDTKQRQSTPALVLTNTNSAFCSDPSPPHLPALTFALLALPPRLNALRSLAPSGFVSAQLRRRVWPLLLGVTAADLDSSFPCPRHASSPPSSRAGAGVGAGSDAGAVVGGVNVSHRDYDQINKDVARSFTRMRHCMAQSNAERGAVARELWAVFAVVAATVLSSPQALEQLGATVATKAQIEVKATKTAVQAETEANPDTGAAESDAEVNSPSNTATAAAADISRFSHHAAVATAALAMDLRKVLAAWLNTATSPAALTRAETEELLQPNSASSAANNADNSNGFASLLPCYPLVPQSFPLLPWSQLRLWRDYSMIDPGTWALKRRENLLYLHDFAE